MGLRVDMTVTLLAALFMMTYICEAGKSFLLTLHLSPSRQEATGATGELSAVPYQLFAFQAHVTLQCFHVSQPC